MVFVTVHKEFDEGLKFFIQEDQDDYGDWIEARLFTLMSPDKVELYNRLLDTRTFQDRFDMINSAEDSSSEALIFPPTHQTLVDSCLEEKHYNDALKMLESLVSKRFYPPKRMIRQIIKDIILEHDDHYLATRAYQHLKHIQVYHGPKVFETLWDDSQEFWSFLDDLTTYVTKDEYQKRDMSPRIRMILDFITGLLYDDLARKYPWNLSDSLLANFFVKYSMPVTKLQKALDIVFHLIEFFKENIEIESLCFNLLDQMILLSHANIFCGETLLGGIYERIYKSNVNGFLTFFTKLHSHVMKVKLIDFMFYHDYSHANLPSKSLLRTPISLRKLALLFQISPNYKWSQRDLMEDLYRYTSLLYLMLQAYTRSIGYFRNVRVFTLDPDEIEVLIKVPAMVKELSKNHSSDFKSEESEYILKIKQNFSLIKTYALLWQS
ncbi:SUMO-interacting [Basidiobolus ranarum]|uniref:SUMO-interacting n=1 Tax=Basidiobolus ranarum TaxID=34480 RepID=A0ABR2W7E3_9FUNG